MKNLYAKGKGKIHPHTPPDAPAALALLPAAIFALAAALTEEDKEVLAYLLTRSLHGSDADRQQRRCCRKSPIATTAAAAVAAVHGPMFDCGCFECYTSFWIRWDSSPDREVIHQAIEAFEEHLASSEKERGGRRRERKEKGKKKKKEVVIEQPPPPPPPLPAAAQEEAVAVEERGEAAAEEEEEDFGDLTEVVVGDRRRGWPDVMGLLNSRFWSLWSPGD